MSINQFKTPKGTVLALTQVKGHPYMTVMMRMVWFREEKPGWGIKSEIIQHSDKLAICKATVTDDRGFIIAEAHKKEDPQGFGDYLEKAETGAKGRALADCGYGTAFALADYDEEHRIVDSPPKGMKGKQDDGKRGKDNHPGSGDREPQAIGGKPPASDKTQNQLPDERKASAVDPKPKASVRDETPISYKDTEALDIQILSSGRDQKKTYDWICKKYSVREIIMLKRWQLEQIQLLLSAKT